LCLRFGEYPRPECQQAPNLSAASSPDVAVGETPTDGGTPVGAEFSYRWEAWSPGPLVFLRGSNLFDDELRRHSSQLKEYLPLPGASVLFGLRAGF